MWRKPTTKSTSSSGEITRRRSCSDAHSTRHPIDCISSTKREEEKEEKEDKEDKEKVEMEARQRATEMPKASTPKSTLFRSRRVEYFGVH